MCLVSYKVEDGFQDVGFFYAKFGYFVRLIIACAICVSSNFIFIFLMTILCEEALMVAKICVISSLSRWLC